MTPSESDSSKYALFKANIVEESWKGVVHLTNIPSPLSKKKNNNNKYSVSNFYIIYTSISTIHHISIIYFLFMLFSDLSFNYANTYIFIYQCKYVTLCYACSQIVTTYVELMRPWLLINCLILKSFLILDFFLSLH